VDKNNNTISGWDEFFRLADHLGSARPGSSKILLCAIDSMIGSATWKLVRLCPFDLGIKGLDG
jgi:hypothetical protein